LVKNKTINDVTDLQFSDNQTYDITGEWTGSQWEYEIYFSYEWSPWIKAGSIFGKIGASLDSICTDLMVNLPLRNFV